MATCNQSTRNTSNTVQTQVKTAQITNNNGGLVKGVDKPFASVGDTITYTVVLKNTGNTAANNLTFIDTIPFGVTFIDDSVAVNGVTQPGANPAPPTGVPLVSLNPGATSTVTFQVWVNTSPAVNLVKNVGEVSYTYTVDPNNPDGSSSSDPTNTTTSTIANASIDTSKLGDKEFAKLNDIITYTITILNNGNTTLNNMIFQDTIPGGGTFKAGSLTVNGASRSENPQDGVNIGSLGVGANTTIAFNVQVTTIPSPNPMINQGNTSYKYTINPSNPNGATGQKATNTIPTTVNFAELSPKKTANPTYILLGDTTVFTIGYKNVGNVDATNVLLIDTIPSGLRFEPGTVQVDGVLNPGADPNVGIVVPNIVAGNATTVTFIVNADTVPTPNPISNVANSSYKYTVDPSNPDGETGTDKSNGLPITVINGSADVEKYTDKQYVSLNENVLYTLRVSNTGNIVLNNVIVYDTIPIGTEFVQGSVQINGVPALGANINTGVSVGNLAIGKTTTVTFKINVNSLPSPNVIENGFDAAFNFTVDPSNPNGYAKRETSNKVGSTVNDAIIGKGPNSFKKTPDKSFATVGDTITYTVNLTNTGNVSGNNVVLKDTIPNGTAFIEDSVTVGGSTVPGANPQSGITLGSITPGNTVTVTFAIVVNTIPTPNPIPNMAALSYSFTKDPSKPDGEKVTGTSNLTTVPVAAGNIPNGSPDGKTGFVKSADKTFGKPGDIITYTFTIPNTGNVPVFNVIFRETIPEGTTFNENSVILNGGVLIGANPELGINVGTINPGAKSILAFKTTVVSLPTVATANDMGFVSYEYSVDPTQPPVKKDSHTNLVTIPIGSANVVITNSVDKDVAQIGDVLTYTLDLTNIGNLDAFNLLIKNNVPAGTEFIPGTVTLDGVTLPNANPETTGISLANLATGGTGKITFQVKVNEIPPSGKIVSIAGVEYEYQPGAGEPPVTADAISNAVVTRPRSVDFGGDNFKKTSNPEYAAIGDIVNFEFKIKNNGNIEALNAVFTDPIPEGTELVQDSVKINGVVQTGANPAAGINLNTIAPGEEIILSFDVKVLKIPTQNPIINKGSLTYESVVNEGQPPVPGSSESTESKTQINSPDVKITKTPNDTSAVVGDVLTYTVTVENTGNVNADAFVIYDQFPADVEFEQGSVTINGIPDINANIISGIELGSVEPNKKVVVTFKVKIIEQPESGKVINTISSYYEFIVDPNKPPRQGSTDSNTSEVIVGVADLKVTKTSDKKNVILGDIITYTIEAENIGTLTLNNILIKDELPKEVDFIDNSLEIDGVKINSVDIQEGVNIGSLEPGEKAIISYKAKYVKSCCSCDVTNSAYGIYEYSLTNSCNGKVKETDRSSVTIKGASSSFKEIIQDGVLVVPPPKVAIEDVNNLIAEVRIVDYHIIKTIKGISEENKRLSGYKLIINGVVIENLEYTACDEVQSVHYSEFHEKFSTFIILPEDFEEGSSVNITGAIEDIYYKQLNEREVYTSVTMIIDARIIC